MRHALHGMMKIWGRGTRPLSNHPSKLVCECYVFLPQYHLISDKLTNPAIAPRSDIPKPNPCRCGSTGVFTSSQLRGQLFSPHPSNIRQHQWKVLRCSTSPSRRPARCETEMAYTAANMPRSQYCPGRLVGLALCIDVFGRVATERW